MSDPTSQAKQARETLANALRALQSDPSVPPDLMAVAEPVSQAMGALFQVERSGAVTTAPAARDHIRTALGQLQAFPGQHPAVATAMEAVASTLGIVFGLVKLAEAGAAAPAAPAYQAPPQQPAAQQPAYQAPPQQPAYQAPPQQPAYQAPPQQPAYQAPPQQPAYQAPPQQPAYQAPQQPAYQAPPQQPAYQAPPQQVPQAPAPQVAAPAGSLKFEAALGTNSPTNFYKGLSGNDVVEHGGIFVATYQKAPKVGSVVQLKVALPGGYDFDAACEVMWTREAAGEGADSLPGFGARFKQVSQEARQLIYRYVRNREPLFHDDF